MVKGRAMRYHGRINYVKCQEWGLNHTQGALFDLLNESSSWAKTHIIGNDVYYWVSRNKVLEELPVVFKRADTVYRNLKVLAEKELIVYVKEGVKDLFMLTEKGKTWNARINSEINPSKVKTSENSEINPSKLGNKSENTPENTDLNPTYKDTNYKSTNDEVENDDNAKKVKDGNAEFVINWQAPSRETMETKLFMAGTPMQMTDGQYQLYVEEFKAHFEERAKDGHPLKSDGKCQARLRDWLQRERKDHNEKMNAGGETANRPHSNRSDSFNQSNQPKLTRQQQIEKDKLAMQQAGLPV